MISKKIIFVLVTLLIALGFSGAGCKERQPKEEVATVTSPFLSQNPSTFDESFNKIKNAADAFSRNFREDNKLFYVRVRIPASLNPDLTQYTFVYNTAAYPNDHWVITFERDETNYIRSLIPKEDFLKESLGQILDLYWKTNFVSVFQKCDQDFGQKFREENPNNFKIELNLARQENQILAWTCQYNTLDNAVGQNSKISAESGEVVK